MTETTRIRWEDDGRNGFEGYAGTLDRHLFAVWQSPCDSAEDVLGEWVLTTRLPAPRDWRTPHGFDPEALKAEAERWLKGFTASLGATFPGEREQSAFPREFLDLEVATRTPTRAGRTTRKLGGSS